MIKGFGLIMISALFLQMLLSCSGTHIAGPSTEQGNPQIVAVVIDSAANKVSGVRVTAYKMAENSDSAQKPSGAVSVAVGFTDKNGRCVFGNIPAGTYSIDAAEENTGRRAIRSGIAVAPAGVHLQDTLTLAQTGALYGVVTRGGVSGSGSIQNSQLQDAAIMVIIQETENVSCLTSQDGKYVFPSLPGGTYTVFYYASDGFYSARKTVSVNAGDTVCMDTVVLRPLGMHSPKGFTYSYVENSILGSGAAVVKFSWNHVEFDRLRWYEVERIDIAGSNDRVFTTTDTLLSDTLVSISAGTVLNYVVRSVDMAFNRSANAGPLQVIVK